MRWTNILVLFGLAVLAGWIMPVADLGGSSGNSLEADVAAVPPPVVASDIPLAGEAGVVLQRQPDGHYYANVDVNYNEIRFIVDTGSTGIALTGDDAQTLGLSWSDEELVVIGRGASGNVYGKRVTLASVQLGDIQVSNIDAVIVPTGLHISLLGQSFLSKAGSVTIANGQMTIS
jgi:aspartyl protease family protein